jgi:short-subunit dehydrogenase
MSRIDPNTVVWITGASSGIGEAIAIEFSHLGCKLILSARRKEELERVKSRCADQDKVEILTLDLSDSFSLPNKALEAESFFGPIDVLVNNGGISQRALAVETDMEVDRQIMEINYFGAVALSKAVLPGQIKKQFGHHVIISSATGIISTPLRSAYAASKHALHGFYDALRAEHHDDNIKVSIFCPGFIRTNISVNALKADGSKQNTMDEAQANGMTAEECAKRIVRSVLSDKEEVYIGGFKEVGGIYIKRFFPSLFSRIVRKMKVT